MRPSADTLFVWTGGSCTNGCGACPIDQGTASAGETPAELQSRLQRISAKGRLVVLVGGEPMLRPDLAQLIAAIRGAGCFPGIVTTGRPLVYPQMRERLRRAGLEYLRAQFFGVGDTHDRYTAVPGGFEQAVAGVRAWIDETEARCDTDVALNLRGRPLRALVAEVERLAQEIESPRAEIIVAIDPSAWADTQNSEILHQAAAALAGWNEDTSRPLVVWEGVPPGEQLPPSLPTLSTWPPAFVGEVPRACCLGPVDDRAPDLGFQQTLANSFNFIRTDISVPWTADAAACTAHAAAGEDAPLRQLWLVEGDQLVLHLTDTGDFADTEIARIKDEWSHLYVDRAPAGVLDDFTEGMRRVLADPTCDTCAHRGHCGRRFRVIEGQPFAREETWIANYMGGLRGRVLDVGCGEQLYREQLAPLLSSGIVDYTGLDPDEVGLTRIRAALPQGRFHLGGIEDFHDEPASYDCIVCVRSLNHVLDVDEALARMATLLKPGGELLIVECTPFAMLRRREQVTAADHAPRAGHQHFRNLTSHEVLPLARRRALRVVHHHAAAQSTTNEWILLLEGTRGG